MKRIHPGLPIAMAFMFISVNLFAQPFTMQEAEARANRAFPMLRQKGLIEKTASLTVENLSKGYIPQLALAGQATYQSDVTRVSIPNAPFVIEPPSRDQYKINMDLSQLIYDGGMIRNQRKVAGLQSQAESRKVDLDIQRLQERVDLMYCNLLYVDAMLEQLFAAESDIRHGIAKVDAQVEGGVAFKSSLNLLKAELLKLEQRRIELNSTRSGLVGVMSVLTDTALSDDVKFVAPEMKSYKSKGNIPQQLGFFQAQKRLAATQLDLLKSKSIPKASAFLQSGYGRPGLNMLKNEFQWFSIGGVRLNWSLSQFYTAKNEKALTALSVSNIELQEESFMKNANAAVKQQLSELDKFEKLIIADKEIIQLRNAVKQSAAAQLEAGILSAHDYIREVNAEDQARQALKAHEIQLLQAQIQHALNTGKQ